MYMWACVAVGIKEACIDIDQSLYVTLYSTSAASPTLNSNLKLYISRIAMGNVKGTNSIHCIV